MGGAADGATGGTAGGAREEEAERTRFVWILRARGFPGRPLLGGRTATGLVTISISLEEPIARRTQRPRRRRQSNFEFQAFASPRATFRARNDVEWTAPTQGSRT